MFCLNVSTLSCLGLAFSLLSIGGRLGSKDKGNRGSVKKSGKTKRSRGSKSGKRGKISTSKGEANKGKGKEYNAFVLSHGLVPKMRVLRDSEVNALFEKYNISDSTPFPKIKASDPSAIAIGAKVGDIIEITRKDITGKYKVYRVVVP